MFLLERKATSQKAFFNDKCNYNNSTAYDDDDDDDDGGGGGGGGGGACFKLIKHPVF